MQTRDFKDFIAGKLVQRIEYKSFSPERINLNWRLTNTNIQFLLSEADRQLGKLDAFSTLIPDVDFFIKMHITKEATVSSKIEGTQTSFQEALISEEDINPEKRDDWKEVNNYVKAINNAIVELEHLPISNRLIKNTHKTLLDGARGYEKLPGEYRTSQNWIGKSLKEAIFIPPTHQEVPELMQDLELFVNAEHTDNSTRIAHLLKIALVHYQFETIHPFLDGNGRIGRLLISLYLIDKKLLKYPTLYLSSFFEKNRRDYYDNLTEVRTKNKIEQWLIFFLQGVIETAENSINTFEEIIKLREDIETKQLPTMGKKQMKAQELIKILYKAPMMSGNEISEKLSIHSSTANRMIKDLMALNLLTEQTGYKRNRIYAFAPYIKLFSN